MAKFGAHTTGQELVDTFPEQVKEKTFIITGPSAGGIGAQTALALASGKPKAIFLLGRSEAKITPVITQIKTISPTTVTTFVPLDLTCFSSIRAAADLVNTSITTFDVLINNAGVMAPGTFQPTSEGIELQFASNHIGHFLLTNLLLPRLAPNGRVVNVSSMGHMFGPVRFEDYNFGEGKEYHPWEAYAQSKTANILFSIGLKKRGVKAYSLHPGAIGTNLGKHIPQEGWPGQWDFFAKHGMKMPERKTLDEGCSTTILAAISPELENSSGAYLVDCTIEEPVEYARSEENAEKLWKLSEKLVGQRFT